MQRMTTTVAGPLFWIGLTVVGVYFLWCLYYTWYKYAKAFKLARGARTALPSLVVPVLYTVIMVGGLVIGSTLVWNGMQSATTNASNYTSEAERNYHQQVTSSNLPSNEQLDQTKADLKNRAEVRPHQKALDDFDAKMAAEHSKIKERSLGGTN